LDGYGHRKDGRAAGCGAERPRPRSGTKEHLRHGHGALKMLWRGRPRVMTRVEQAFRPAYSQLIKNCHPERSATGCERSELEREREVEGPWYGYCSGRCSPELSDQVISSPIKR